tara:strand:- start:99 stop:524 length:426 start_codon:yes stop_codon:yes gene_type:complete
MKLDLPNGLISPEKAKEMNQEFIKTRSKELDKIVEKLDNKPKKKDALSSWFSLEEIKNYIAYVESKASDVNGLRVYFGAYGKKATEKSNVSTVFLVPTRLKPETIQKGGIAGGFNSDIGDVEALNNGSTGHPPSGEYPQEL